MSDDAQRLRRRVLWSIPTGLYLVGSRATMQGADRVNLMTASLVIQVATSPTLLGVSIDVAAWTHELVSASDRFTVCLLDRNDRGMVRKFVKPLAPEAAEFDAAGHLVALGGEAVFEAPSGTPVLVKSFGWLDCVVRQRVEAASHTFFVGEVKAAGERTPKGEAEEVTGTGVLRMEDTRMHYGG